MENFKWIAGQASSINQYKNTRPKLLKYYANVFFNKKCLATKIIPNYAKIKVQNTSPAAKLTSKKAQTTRMKDEIKLLFKKKDKLNRELYEHHLKAAKEWGTMWHIIHWRDWGWPTRSKHVTLTYICIYIYIYIYIPLYMNKMLWSDWRVVFNCNFDFFCRIPL